MSTLRADTIQSTGGGAATLTNQSAAKQWLQYNQETPAVTGSFNVSSVSDDSTGNFTTSLANNVSSTSNVAVTGLSNQDSGDSTRRGIAFKRDAGGTFNTGQYPVDVVDMGNGSSNSDQKFNFTLLHGDLA